MKYIKNSRKQLRKQQRKQKKARRNEYYTNRKKQGKYVSNPNKTDPSSNAQKNRKRNPKTPVSPNENTTDDSIDLGQDKEFQKEKKKHEKLQKQMRKQRTEQLKRANADEDRTIKKLEKQLKLNKRKSKALPKTFASDGLDCMFLSLVWVFKQLFLVLFRFAGSLRFGKYFNSGCG